MTLRGGLDLGGTKIEAIVVDEKHAIVGRARRITPTSGGPPAVVAELETTMREAVAAAGVELSALAGVGVGAPGEVDPVAGTLARAGNLPGWDGVYPVVGELSSALGVPVRIGNDVRVAVEAERVLGAGRTYRSFLGAWWGTGVGGALVLDGALWLGRGSAGELGHIVVKLGGRRCPCGRRGCLEAYAGRAAMERTARKAEDAGTKTKLFSIMKKRDRTRLTSGVWAAALAEQDKLARNLIDEAVEALGAGIGSVQNLLDLDAIVVGGGLGTRLGQPFVERIAAAAQPHLFVDDRPPAFVLSELGDDGGGLGAALLVSG
ncbi:MAG TPA: ROK family protein [Gaiellaceae bacterium]